MQILVHENEWLDVTFPQDTTFEEIEKIAAVQNQSLTRDSNNKPVLVHNRTGQVTQISIAA